MSLLRVSLVSLLALVFALSVPCAAHADWMSLQFGLDGPEALEKLVAISGVAPDKSPAAGGALYGLLDPATRQDVQARFEGQYFVGKVRFVFSNNKLFAVEMTPRNVGWINALDLLIAEYGAPDNTLQLSPEGREYTWRDAASKNFVLFRVTPNAEPTVIYRPLLNAHATGF